MDSDRRHCPAAGYYLCSQRRGQGTRRRIIDMKDTVLRDLLGIRYPIIQAPMVWIATAELAGAVSEAGGLGCIGPNAGATTVSPDIEVVSHRLLDQIARTRALINKPFAVNVAIGHGPARVFSDRYAEIIIRERVPVAIVSQGSPDIYLSDLHRAGVKVLHVVASAAHARKAEAAGVDAVITNSYEGGGHSGWDALCTFTLLPQVADAVQIPVIAGGGIADARGLVAALALGAAGVYMGTRFMATVECPAADAVKEVFVAAGDTATASIIHGLPHPSPADGEAIKTGGPVDIDRQYRGGRRRALNNEFHRACLDLMAGGASPDELQDFINSTVPGTAGSHRVLAGLIEGDMESGLVPCGQAVGLIKSIPTVDELIAEMMRGAAEIIRDLPRDFKD